MPHLFTATLTVVLLALAQSTAAMPPPGKGGGKPDSGGGGDGGASCSYPAFADIPRERLERRERKSRYDDFTLRYGWVQSAIANLETPVQTLVENGAPETSSDVLNSNDAAWTDEDMTDPLNRSGNAGIDEFGFACTNCTPEGKRFSAWYDDLQSFAGEDTVMIGEASPMDVNVLTLGGDVEGLPGGPPVPDLTRPGALPWSDVRPRTGWLKTWERGQNGNDWVVEGSLDEPGKHKFRAPMYLEASVNFSRMRTPGFRLSLWLMPATFELSDDPTEPDAFVKTVASDECDALQEGLLTNGCYSDPTPGFRSEAYDRNWKNGYEMDIFEFEPAGVIDITDENGNTEEIVCGNAIEFSALNDYIGNRGNDTEYAVKNHFEGFEEGYCDPATDYGDLSCDKTYANPAQDTNYLINDDVWHKIGFLWTAKELLWIFNGEIVLEIADTDRIPHSSVYQYLNLSREITNGLTAGTIVPTGNTYDTYLPAEAGLYGWDGRSNAGDFLDHIAGDEAMIRYIKIWNLNGLTPP